MSQVVSDIYLDRDRVQQFVSQISEIGGPLSLVSISSGEDEPGYSVTEPVFSDYLKKSVNDNTGFILHTSASTLVFGPTKTRTWKISVEDIEESYASRLMDAAAAVFAHFAFSCSLDELNYRNKIVLGLSYGREEAWVGRDFTKYVPGVYWLTLLPMSRISDFDELERIVTTSNNMDVTSINDRAIVRLYDSPDDWVEGGKVDEIAKTLCRPVFSKRAVENKLKGADDFISVSEELSLRP